MKPSVDDMKFSSRDVLLKFPLEGGGGGWVHHQAKISMVMSGLSCRMALGGLFSPPFAQMG